MVAKARSRVDARGRAASFASGGARAGGFLLADVPRDQSLDDRRERFSLRGDFFSEVLEQGPVDLAVERSRRTAPRRSTAPFRYRQAC